MRKFEPGQVKYDIDDNPFQVSKEFKDRKINRGSKASSVMNFPLPSNTSQNLKKIKEEKSYSNKSLNSVNEKESQDEDGATGGTGQSMKNHDDSRNNLSVQSKGSKSAAYDKSGDKKNYKNILT